MTAFRACMGGFVRAGTVGIGAGGCMGAKNHGGVVGGLGGVYGVRAEEGGGG